jgi:phosphoribosyl-AMP cyclohydrolase / phosphoribosyl-ATP pyrophosphohydrolase
MSARTIDFVKGGGIAPVVVQDADTLQVLILAYMNAEALAETQRSGEAVFYSRSRQALWRKGETSGNRLDVVAITMDCDDDAILLQIRPRGPACHRGTTSCFGEATAPGIGQLAALERRVHARAVSGDESSYTARLLKEGVRRIAQKVGEEGVETALAGAAGDDQELCNEAADLLYHLTVLLHARGLSLNDVAKVLGQRANP